MKPRKRVGNYWHVLIRCNTLRSETKKGWVEKKKGGGAFPTSRGGVVHMKKTAFIVFPFWMSTKPYLTGPLMVNDLAKILRQCFISFSPQPAWWQRFSLQLLGVLYKRERASLSRCSDVAAPWDAWRPRSALAKLVKIMPWVRSCRGLGCVCDEGGEEGAAKNMNI